MVLDDSSGSIEKLDDAFYRSFASDVKKFLEPILHEHFVAESALKREATATSARSEVHS
jgi:hypothetical protein